MKALFKASDYFLFPNVAMGKQVTWPGPLSVWEGALLEGRNIRRHKRLGPSV